MKITSHVDAGSTNGSDAGAELHHVRPRALLPRGRVLSHRHVRGGDLHRQERAPAEYAPPLA